MSATSPSLFEGKAVMEKQGLGRGEPIGPLDWLRLLPHEAAASSDRMVWVGLEAARCRATPAFEVNLPALTHHRLFLFASRPRRSPENRAAASRWRAHAPVRSSDGGCRRTRDCRWQGGSPPD